VEHRALVGGTVTALVIRRLVGLVPTLLAVSVLVFFIMSMGPSPTAVLQEYGNMTAEDIAKIAHERGWDKPKIQQYLGWLGGYVTGDWGESVRTLQPVAEMIFERLPLTLTIASFALFFSVGIGLPLGAYVAVRKYSKIDYATTFITLALMAMPGFFLALVLQLMAVKLRDATGGVVFYTSGIPDGGATIEWIQRLALPVATLTLTHIAIWVRYQRGELLNVLGQEYIKAARAKGLPERVVFMRHAVRNAVLPIITLIAIDMGKLVAGAIIVESVFGLPGIGTLVLDSVNGHDTPVVLAVLMLVAGMMVLCSLMADLLYGLLDPRVGRA
jgi:peptide/nickel transport system permease protein